MYSIHHIVKYNKAFNTFRKRLLESRFVSFFVLLAFIFLSWSPVANNDCVKEVQDIYKNMKMDDLDKGNVYMNYTITTHYKPDGDKPRKNGKTDIEFVIGKEQMHYKTPEVIVYIDTKDNFTIIPDRKVIYWSNSMLEIEKEKRIKAFTILQDTLFSISKVIECKTKINTAEGYDKIVTMEPMEKWKKVYPYMRYAFYISTKEKAIKKVIIDFLPQYEFTKIELRYNKIELNYTKVSLMDPVKNIVLTADGKLNSTYKAYTLIDNRAKSSR